MEIAICLLPLAIEAQAIESIVKTIDASPLTNTPHISLFQMNMKEERIEELIEKLSSLARSHSQTSQDTLSFQVKGIINKYENIVLDLVPCYPSVQHTLKADIIEAVKDLRAIEPMAQINLSALTSEQKELVSNYGIYWGVGPFLKANHLTISYNNIGASIPVPQEIETLTVDRLAVGKIGEVGNLESICWEKPLTKSYSSIYEDGN